MQRRDFIKLSSISVVGVTGIGSFSFKNRPAKEVLTGRTSSHILTGGVIHKNALLAFMDMQNDAKKAGINIHIASGFRSFERQLFIWNRKFQSYSTQGLSPLQSIKKIIEYSTIPGTSRHHWGTDIDVIDLNFEQPKGELLNEKNYHGKGPFCHLKEWMENYAENYGFYLTYTPNYHRTGFNYEPWHYSYRPIAVDYLNAFLELDINSILNETDILGKAQLTTEMLAAYQKSHILGINPVLLPN
jgi:hypothetical protein